MDSTRSEMQCMSDDFYRAFEEKYRGPRSEIIERLAAYHAFIAPLAAAFPGASAIDLGCGRGEWLEVLQNAGLSPLGIDLDEGMLRACIELGLPAEKGDALSLLSSLPNQSQIVVSAFHFVEHISFEQLRTVVREALRVLKPGGLLIMETPNPENIAVGTCHFYIDPTHQRPIPSQLLSFLPEHYGFSRVKVVRLQESKELAGKESLTLLDVLNGVSPDYAVVAQKQGGEELMEALVGPFNTEYGLTLETLCSLYDNTISRIHTQAQSAEVKAQSAEAQAQSAGLIAQSAEARAQSSEVQLENMRTSRSWRLTEPLRWCALQLRLLKREGLHARINSLFRKIGR